MKVKVMCSKFECQKDIHFKTQPGPVAKNALQVLRWELNPRPLNSRTTLYQLSYRSRC